MVYSMPWRSSAKICLLPQGMCCRRWPRRTRRTGRPGTYRQIPFCPSQRRFLGVGRWTKGVSPTHYTKAALCARCGPIWLWFSGKVLGCPWCWNRVADKPEAIARLWDTDRRYCERFLPRPRQTHNDQPRPTRAETKSKFSK